MISFSDKLYSSNHLKMWAILRTCWHPINVRESIVELESFYGGDHRTGKGDQGYPVLIWVGCFIFLCLRASLHVLQEWRSA